MTDTAERDAHAAAITRYRQAMRRQRTVYYSILLVVVTVLGVVVGLAYSRGELAHTTLRTVSTAPPTLAAAAPSQQLDPAWRKDEHAAIGSPQYGGTVITYSEHTVSGRDARTGERTWSYTRSDHRVCTAAQLSGVTVAVYELHDNCDQLTALASDTGERRWTRTLDMDGMPVNGVPDFQADPGTMLVTTDEVIYALDPISGLNRWTYQRYGCRIDRAVLGSSGVLISQDCAATVECGELKHCASGPQLLMRDGVLGNNEGKPDADRIRWLVRGAKGIPASSDGVVSVVEPAARSIVRLDADSGSRTSSTVLRGPVGSHPDVAAVPVGVDELIWVAGRTYLIGSDPAVAGWDVATTGPATVTAADDELAPGPDTARVAVPTRTGIAELDPATGRLHPYPVPAPAPGSRVYPLGAGFLVAGPDSTAVYA